MAYTTAQLETVESAIISLAGGAEEVRIGDKMFRKSSLGELRKLRNEMYSEIMNSSDGGILKTTFVNKESI